MQKPIISAIAAILCFIAVKVVAIYTSTDPSECFMGLCLEILRYGIA
jgi:hypothetical protein